MSTQNLEKSFKTKDVFAMAFGTMIGWGWIMLSGQWAASAGMLGAILAYVVGALLCIFVGLIYSELTPAIPFTGGGVVFAYKSMGYWPSVFAGLATALAYLGVAAWEGPAFSTALNYVVPIPKIGKLWTIQESDVYVSISLVAIIASIIITYLNYKGAKQTAIFQTIATVGLIAVGLVFLTGGAFAAGLKVAEIMEKEDYPGKALKISEKCFEVMGQCKEKYDVIGDVRGLGSMLGVEFVKDRETKEPNSELVSNIINYAAHHGLLLEAAGVHNNFIRFLCPLCVTDAQLEKGLEIFEEAIKACI